LELLEIDPNSQEYLAGPFKQGRRSGDSRVFNPGGYA
jgi:hypothetical protein